METRTLGIDLAKNIFYVSMMDAKGNEILSKSFRRKKLVEFVTKQEVMIIGMEACGGAHHFGRLFQEMGHEVRLVAPQFVKPFVRGEKNDKNDARAIAECVMRPNMRFVAVKSIKQQELQMWHRMRSGLVNQRKSLSNELRGLLAEFGYVMPTGYRALEKKIIEIVSLAESPFEDRTKDLLLQMRMDLVNLEKRILGYEEMFARLCREVDVCKRLIQIEGVGIITATAIWAHVGEASRFKNGRQFAAYLGLVPKQNSSGGKVRLSGITKRGDKTIRQLLIHGARAVVRFADKRLTTSRKHRWVHRIDKERGRNKACVALANKNARTIWALMYYGTEYKTA